MLGRIRSRIQIPRTENTQDREYPGQRVPRTESTQDREYPGQRVPRTESTQDREYPGHRYPGHRYPGHTYPGHTYPGQSRVRKHLIRKFPYSEISQNRVLHSQVWLIPGNDRPGNKRFWDYAILGPIYQTRLIPETVDLGRAAGA
jgi:hypothetical protein